ncbi:hypothetical protein [Phenylobacterium sp.]|uniref:hypothetical protein n=1 Tax=Phenylobacterium sp. TaxID=1871053 RepID=UPI0025E48FCD|nr:hypothetical protein [Phenylobacterium sp.]
MSAIRTILFARLLFPAPRVRWEAARSVATLIRAGDATVASDLLAWIAARPLESEAVLGLNLIEAFKLGAHFTPSALAEAVGAPSVLSATLFARLYPGVELDASKQWAFAPDGPAPISALQKRWFDRYRTWAVAPLFTMILSDLQRATGAPFLERWRHEWEWLQSQHERPAPEYPQFFSGYDRERKGQFDQSQRDIYLSAYLRTLAFAVSRWGLPSRIAEDRAGAALVFNRDLADIEPIARPAWAMDVYPDDDGDIAVGVRGLLAKMDLEAEQEPVAVRVIDLQDDRFIDIDVRLALIPRRAKGRARIRRNCVIWSPTAVAGWMGPSRRMLGASPSLSTNRSS